MGWVIFGIICFIIIIYDVCSWFYDGITKDSSDDWFSNIGKTKFYSNIFENLTGRKQDDVEKALTYAYVREKNKEITKKNRKLKRCNDNDLTKKTVENKSNTLINLYEEAENTTNNFVKNNKLIINDATILQNRNISIIDGEYVKIYFFVNGSKRSIVLREYCKRKGYLARLENCFKDDITENYQIKLKKENLYDLIFISYCFSVNQKFDNYAIYNIRIDEYLNGINDSEYPLLNKYSIIDNSNKENFKQLVKELYIKFKEEYKENKFPSKFPYPIFYYAEQTRMLNEFLDDNEPTFKELIEYQKNWNPEKYKIAHEKKIKLIKSVQKEYNNLYQELVSTTDYFKIRWINEFSLYSMVKELYPDAIYQYHESWLDLQSLDIYIPSLKVGIEYQGMQHYKPIDFFGGEKEFEHRKKLDLKKKEKCRENNIKLIEWKYDEPISNVMLTKKMEKLSKSED